MIIQESTKIRDFVDLKTWQQAHALCLTVYKATKQFPREELFGLTSQVRRASVSVVSNIAEGFGRQTRKEKRQFYYQANGSLLEVRSQLFIARDLGYIKIPEVESAVKLTNEVQALLQGMLRTAESHRKYKPEYKV